MAAIAERLAQSQPINAFTDETESARHELEQLLEQYLPGIEFDAFGSAANLAQALISAGTVVPEDELLTAAELREKHAAEMSDLRDDHETELRMIGMGDDW